MGPQQVIKEMKILKLQKFIVFETQNIELTARAQKYEIF